MQHEAGPPTSAYTQLSFKDVPLFRLRDLVAAMRAYQASSPPAAITAIAVVPQQRTPNS